ncbi:hypothetical protein ABZP36_024132 [Zizania latifolia]
MASLTMMASLSAVSGAVAADRRVAAPRRGSLAVARAAAGGRGTECQPAEGTVQAEEALSMGAEGRRAVMLAAAAAALSAIGGAGVALAEAKRGTPEAKKKYASICVTMPTAKICHN